jgi:hypothetical protein
MSKGVLTSRLLERAGVSHGFTTRQLGDALVDLSGWEKATGLKSQSLVRLKQVNFPRRRNASSTPRSLRETTRSSASAPPTAFPYSCSPPGWWPRSTPAGAEL